MSDAADAKVRTLALIVKFGHDLYRCTSVENCAVEAVNNAFALLKFRSSALYAVSEEKLILLGRYGTAEVNPHSPRCDREKALLADLDPGSDLTIRPLPDGDETGSFAALRLPPPPAGTGCAPELIWFLEFPGEIPPPVQNTIRLLGSAIAEALTFHHLAAASGGKKRHRKKHFRKLFATLIILLLAAVMFIPVRESAKGEFVLKAPEITAVYAKIDAPVKLCLKPEGAKVKKGELVLQLDQEQLNYKLHITRSQLQEIEAELNLERNAAFPDQTRLGKVRLLEARRKAAAVAVEEAQWKLQHSSIYAPCDGIVSFGTLRPEELANRHFHTGDKLFEVLSGQGMSAEIEINERDASVLQDSAAPPRAELFLHTAPERAIAARITEISQVPEINAERNYCFKLRARPDADRDMNRYGMRGVAKLYGPRVSLGYALFKSTVLYFRGW